MKKLLSLILIPVLCLLVCAIGQAEAPVIVEDAYKLTFVTADFEDNWAEYAGSGAPLPNVSKPQYCLRVYVMDPAATGNYDRLSDQLRGWHMVDPDGNLYDCTSGSYYQTDGLYRDLILIFQRSEPLAENTRYAPGEMLLATQWQGETIPLDGVPRDTPAVGADPTPPPTEPPYDIQLATGMLYTIKGQSDIRREETPSLTGKLAVAVYEDWDDTDPVLSYRDDRFVDGRIPPEYLAQDMDSADMLVLIWPEFEAVGMYNSGSFAHRCMTRVCVYDIDRFEPILLETVAANDPPQTVNDRETHSGAFEPFTAVDWISARLE